MVVQQVRRFAFLSPLLLAVSGTVAALGVHAVVGIAPSQAAQEVAFQYGPLKRVLPVKDIKDYAETKKASPQLQSLLNILGTKNQATVQESLQVKVPVDIVELNKALDTTLGKQLLTDAASATVRSESEAVKVQALRSALILGANQSGGLGIVGFLEAYPGQRLTVDLAQASKLFEVNKKLIEANPQILKQVSGVIKAPVTVSGKPIVQPTLTTTAGRPVTVRLTGAAEVPGPGDADGTGTAFITLNPGQKTICVNLSVANIATPTAAHIHTGTVTQSGPVLFPLTTPVNGTSTTCLSTTRADVKAILQNPAAYYVNVHNSEFTNGAVRGQLVKF